MINHFTELGTASRSATWDASAFPEASSSLDSESELLVSSSQSLLHGLVKISGSSRSMTPVPNSPSGHVISIFTDVSSKGDPGEYSNAGARKGW